MATDTVPTPPSALELAADLLLATNGELDEAGLFDENERLYWLLDAAYGELMPDSDGSTDGAKRSLVEAIELGSQSVEVKAAPSGRAGRDAERAQGQREYMTRIARTAYALLSTGADDLGTTKQAAGATMTTRAPAPRFRHSAPAATISKLSEIVRAADGADRRSFHQLAGAELEETELHADYLREVIQRIGWLAETVLCELGADDILIRDGKADEWLLAPSSRSNGDSTQFPEARQ